MSSTSHRHQSTKVNCHVQKTYAQHHCTTCDQQANAIYSTLPMCRIQILHTRTLRFNGEFSRWTWVSRL